VILFTIRVSSPELLGIIDASQVPRNKAIQVVASYVYILRNIMRRQAPLNRKR